MHSNLEKFLYASYLPLLFGGGRGKIIWVSDCRRHGTKLIKYSRGVTLAL